MLDSINKDIESAKLFKEQQEARKRAEEERKAEIERIAKEQAEASIKAYDAETGEVIEEEPKPEPVNGKYVTTIKFWFDLDQAKQFKEWLDAHEIKFETVEGMKKC